MLKLFDTVSTDPHRDTASDASRGEGVVHHCLQKPAFATRSSTFRGTERASEETPPPPLTMETTCISLGASSPDGDDSITLPLRKNSPCARN